MPVATSPTTPTAPHAPRITKQSTNDRFFSRIAFYYVHINNDSLRRFVLSLRFNSEFDCKRSTRSIAFSTIHGSSSNWSLLSKTMKKKIKTQWTNLWRILPDGMSSKYDRRLAASWSIKSSQLKLSPRSE